MSIRYKKARGAIGAHFASFVPFVEIQKVKELNTFRGDKKSLAIWRFCSTFAVEFAKKTGLQTFAFCRAKLTPVCYAAEAGYFP